MTPENYWALPSKEDTAFLRSVLPVSASLSVNEIEGAVRLWCWRKLWTGINQFDALISGQQLTEGRETLGTTVVRWLVDNAALNNGLGPTISCGTLAHAYIALLAAYGIYARLVIATNDREPDHTAEYFDGRKWVHVLPHCNGHFESTFTGERLSYQEWSNLALQGSTLEYRYASPTGGLPIVPRMDKYAGWPGFWTSAVVSNGNEAYVVGKKPWRKWQIWQDPKDRPFAWKGEQVDQATLYPDLSFLTRTSSSSSSSSRQP